MSPVAWPGLRPQKPAGLPTARERMRFRPETLPGEWGSGAGAWWDTGRPCSCPSQPGGLCGSAPAGMGHSVASVAAHLLPLPPPLNGHLHSPQRRVQSGRGAGPWGRRGPWGAPWLALRLLAFSAAAPGWLRAPRVCLRHLQGAERKGWRGESSGLRSDGSFQTVLRASSSHQDPAAPRCSTQEGPETGPHLCDSVQGELQGFDLSPQASRGRPASTAMGLLLAGGGCSGGPGYPHRELPLSPLSQCHAPAPEPPF